MPAIFGRCWKGETNSCVLFTFVFSVEFHEWLFEQNVRNDENLSGVLQKENQHFICAQAPSVWFLSMKNFRSYFSCFSSTWVVSHPRHTHTTFLLTHREKTLRLSAIRLSRDEYFNGGRCFFFSNACLLPTALEQAIMDCASSKRRLSFEHRSLSFLLLLPNFAPQSV